MFQLKFQLISNNVLVTLIYRIRSDNKRKINQHTINKIEAVQNEANEINSQIGFEK